MCTFFGAYIIKGKGKGVQRRVYVDLHLAMDTIQNNSELIAYNSE